MNENTFDTINECAKYLDIEKYVGKLPAYAYEHNLTPEAVEVLGKVMEHIRDTKQASVIETLLNFSRLPKVDLKTFENFDFERVHGKNVEKLKSLPSLSAVYSRKNLAFIGPTGLGKTHLAMAFGRACCMNELKTYFLKASELNQRFKDARKYGRTGSVINGLVKPTCLIIDEIGHDVFDKENTRLFFDVIDRRYCAAAYFIRHNDEPPPGPDSPNPFSECIIEPSKGKEHGNGRKGSTDQSAHRGTCHSTIGKPKACGDSV